MVSASEFARLTVALAVLPLLISANRGLRVEKSIGPYYAILVGLVYLAYVLTILEGFFAPELMNTLQHLCYGVAGILAIPVAWFTRVDVLAKRGLR